MLEYEQTDYLQQFLQQKKRHLLTKQEGEPTMPAKRVQNHLKTEQSGLTKHKLRQ